MAWWWEKDRHECIFVVHLIILSGWLDINLSDVVLHTFLTNKIKSKQNKRNEGDYSSPLRGGRNLMKAKVKIFKHVLHCHWYVKSNLQPTTTTKINNEQISLSICGWFLKYPTSINLVMWFQLWHILLLNCVYLDQWFERERKNERKKRTKFNFE